MQFLQSNSLWNFSISQGISRVFHGLSNDIFHVCQVGWTEEETNVLRAALMKHGIGKWQIVKTYLPWKSIAQLNLQTQRLFGQQSLAGLDNCARLVSHSL